MKKSKVQLDQHKNTDTLSPAQDPAAKLSPLQNPATAKLTGRTTPTKKKRRPVEFTPHYRGKQEITVSLTIAELAVISQRSLDENLSGVAGVWSQLWNRIEKEIEKR